MIRVSDSKLLEWPTKDQPVILPNQVGGYVSPDKTFHEIATADIQMLEDLMNVTLWGVQAQVKTQGMSVDQGGQTKTATEIINDIKPQADRLVVISEMAEKRHKFILDAVIRLNMNLFNYQGSSVSYGRRYMLEGPDAIWSKYSDARTKGSPQNVLDTLLSEYNEANYPSDPVALAVAQKMMYVEPFVHYTAANLKALNPDPADYKAKLYFPEWLAMQNNSILLSQTVEQLRQSLMEYVKAKNVVEPAAAPIFGK